MGEAAKVLPAIPAKDKEGVTHLSGLPALYKDYEIKTHEDCEFAAKVLSDAKSEAKKLEERRKAITKPLDDAKKSVMELFRPAVDAVDKLERILKPKVSAYFDEQERLRRIAEAEAAEKQRKEREKLEAQAEKARSKGQEEKAEVLEMRAVTQVVVTAPEPQKVSGISVRKIWTAEVSDPVAVCKLIAEGVLPPSIVSFSQAELNKVASTWQNSKQFDGLVISQKSSVASR